MEVTSTSFPPNYYAAIRPSSNRSGSDIQLTSSAVLEHAASGVVIGTVDAGDDTWTYILVPGYDAGGRIQIVGNQLETTATALDFATSATAVIRIHATRATPYMEIIEEFVLDVLPILNALTITGSKAFTIGDAAGTVLGTISGAASGATLSIAPADGKVVLVGNEIRIGSTASVSGSHTYGIIQTKGVATYETDVNIVVSSPVIAPPSSGPRMFFNAVNSSMVAILHNFFY